MPIFDYRCKDCAIEFEVLVFSDNEDIKCIECNSRAVEKTTVSLFSCTSVQLDKRGRLDSVEQMSQGQKMMNKQKWRGKRIKIL